MRSRARPSARYGSMGSDGGAAGSRITSYNVCYTKLLRGAVIFGITLSTLHQSGLGALFLLAPAKIHPLWYSHFIPVLFFVSSIFAGLSMVV